MVEWNVGRKIKELREEKELTLRELSRLSGVSATQISEIERNLTAPTVPTLMKIVSALGTDVSIFFESGHINNVSVVRKNERQEFIDRKNHVFLQRLTKGITGTRLKAVLAYPPPGKENIRGGYSHPGEELLYVIKGKIQVTVGKDVHILAAGDCIHFRGELRHIIKNITNSKAEVISIITPPNY